MRGAPLVLAALLIAWSSASAQAQSSRREACVSAHERGQELRLRGSFADARAQFLSCSQARCPDLIRRDCRALLSDLDARQPSLVFSIRDADGAPLPGARVLVDGKDVGASSEGQAVPIDPGAHVLRVEAPGYAPREQTVQVAEGERARPVVVALEALSGRDDQDASAAGSTAARGASRRRVRTYAPLYGLGGAALGALATGVVLGGLGYREKQRLEERCGDVGCREGETHRGKALYIAADIAFGVGGALAVTTAALYFARYFRRSEAGERAVRGLDAQVAAGSATLLWRGAF